MSPTTSAFVADQMEQGLRALQTVKPYDYDAAYHKAFAGSTCLRPGLIDMHAMWFHGRVLALELWTNRMAATTDLAWEQIGRDASEAVAA